MRLLENLKKFRGNKTIIIIPVAVFIFIGINSLFYILIFNQQRNFHIQLLMQQVRICGNTIEERGNDFESDLTFIPFSEDITKFFDDPRVRERTSKDIELFYSKYENLINNIRIYDNEHHVYRLLKDKRHNFVSDYYESQVQEKLSLSEELRHEGDSYLYAVPVFNDDSKVQSNIVININFRKYIETVFDQYRLENTLWQWILPEMGQPQNSHGQEFRITGHDQDNIRRNLQNGNEGSMVHSIAINGKTVKVISAYIPVNLVRKEFGIVFSMKSDLFLKSIISKTILITIASILLLILILFLHFQVLKVKSDQEEQYRLSESAIRTALDRIPAGLVILGKEGKVINANKTAGELLHADPQDLDAMSGAARLMIEYEGTDVPVYERAFGRGSLIRVADGDAEKFLFRQTGQFTVLNEQLIYALLLDVSSLESNRRQSYVARQARNELLADMKKEIAVPLDEINDVLAKMDREKSGPNAKGIAVLGKSFDLLSNLVHTSLDFSMTESYLGILDEIPFSLREELNRIIEPLKGSKGGNKRSIITKIRNDIPDRVIGDPFRFRMIFRNLLDNSIELTEEGRVLISAEVSDLRPELMFLRFKIEDTGKGLPGELVREYEKLNKYPLEPSAGRLPGKIGDRISVSKQQIELMSGELRVWAGSSISTNPANPGTCYAFSLELIPDEFRKELIDDAAVTDISNLHCLMLAPGQAMQEAYTDPFDRMGIKVKHRLMSHEDPGAVAEFLSDRIHEYHLLLIPESNAVMDLKLMGFLDKQNLTGHFLIMVLSTQGDSRLLSEYKKRGVDYYLKFPGDEERLKATLSLHFKGIPPEQFNEDTVPETSRELRILLVDDNVISRKLAQSMFKKVGHEIDQATNGDEAIEKIGSERYDIVFMDLLMPEMDGLETSEKIRKLGHDLPIIAFTAVDPGDIREDAQKAGINEFLIKPADPDSLKKILLKYCTL